jgi:hypothetical protein
MEIRPLSAPHALLAGLSAEAALMTAHAVAPAPAAPAVGAGELLAGLNSPLAAAGLLAPAALPENTVPAAFKTTVAATLDMPAGPSADQGRLGVPVPGMEAQAAQPLAPAWITTLHTHTLRQGPWPDPQAPVRQREQQRRQRQARPDEPETPAAGAPGADEADGAAADDGADHAAAFMPLDDSRPAPWPADTWAPLPEAVKAELQRRRAVLLVAPPGPGQRGLQLVCLGFDLRGRPLLRRWGVRGSAAASTCAEPAWQLWRVRREGDDGQRPVLAARALAPGRGDGGGLVLRVTATVRPPPLRPADHAWLDVLEPQRLWRDLGSQWTLLLAWAPHALRWPPA